MSSRPALTAPPGTTERAIEIPWVLGQYRGERRVLDIGYAHALPDYLDGLAELRIPRLLGVDVNTRPVRPAGMKTVVADVRELPFRFRRFDLIICVSTLEHIDNRLYGIDGTDPDGIPAALHELRRVLSRNGRLLVTVPTGEREDKPEFLQATPDEWQAIFEATGFTVRADVWELTDNGWRPATGALAGARYGERGPAASAVLCAELRRSQA